jgi:hypothetical protein
LDKLFSKKEIMDGAIEPTGAGKFPALDSARVAILKGILIVVQEIKFLIRFLNHFFIILFRCN